LNNGEREINEFAITDFDADIHRNLFNRFFSDLKPFIAALDYREQALVVKTDDASYHFDADRETLVKTVNGVEETLGCGKIVVKITHKDATAKQKERIDITVELTADYQKDYEIIPFQTNPDDNQQAIADFMKKYVSKPFTYLDNVVGVEINFNKVFYKPEKLDKVSDLLKKIQQIDEEIKQLEKGITL
jgi:type I restriction enzyme M protein